MTVAAESAGDSVSLDGCQGATAGSTRIDGKDVGAATTTDAPVGSRSSVCGPKKGSLVGAERVRSMVGALLGSSGVTAAARRSRPESGAGGWHMWHPLVANGLALGDSDTLAANTLLITGAL